MFKLLVALVELGMACCMDWFPVSVAAVSVATVAVAAATGSVPGAAAFPVGGGDGPLSVYSFMMVLVVSGCGGGGSVLLTIG